MSQPVVAPSVINMRIQGMLWLSMSFLLTWIFSQFIQYNPVSPVQSSYLLVVFQSILFSFSMSLLCTCLGKKLLGYLKIQLPSFSEWLLAVALGFGTLALSIFFLGLVGWLNTTYFLILYAAAALFCADQLPLLLSWIATTARGLPHILVQFNRLQKTVLILFLLILMFGFIQALTPPFDYDGLAYHLQNPRLFLEAGRIQPMPENWLTYYPSLYEMLYLAGLVFKTDIAAKLLHFGAFLLLLGSLYSFTSMLFSRRIARMAMFLMSGIPILPIWASTAYVDLAWSLFQLLAIGLVLIWVRERKTGFLILAGIFQGFALGCKYLAFVGLGLLGVIILWESWREKQNSGKLLRSIQNGSVFTLSALLPASPWYLKNLLWTGDPLFPLLLTPSLVDPRQIELWVEYMQSFGYHQTWFDYLSLPFRWIFNHRAFGTFLGEVDLPHPLFLLFPILLWTRRKETAAQRKTLDLLSFLILGMFIAWAFNSQQSRFLLPVYPLLSLVCAQILVRWAGSDSLGRIIKSVSLAICLVMTIFAAVITLNALVYLAPLQLVKGAETRPQFLARMINNYEAQVFILQNLHEDARVYMPWDARSYYCDKRCVPDIDQIGWATRIEKNPTVADLRASLENDQMSHLLLSKSDADYFTLGHDTEKVHSNAYQFTVERFLPACGILIFQNENSCLYKLDFSLPSCR